MKSCFAILGPMAVALAACSSQSADETPDLPDSGKAALAERLYQDNCAACHDSGVNGAPTRTAIERKSQADVLASMNGGIMQAQAANLSAIDRVVLAEYLGQGHSARKATDPKCEGELAFSGAPLWNRWGNGQANTRFQSAQNAGLTAGQCRSAGAGMGLRLSWRTKGTIPARSHA